MSSRWAWIHIIYAFLARKTSLKISFNRAIVRLPARSTPESQTTTAKSGRVSYFISQLIRAFTDVRILSSIRARWSSWKNVQDFRHGELHRTIGEQCKRCHDLVHHTVTSFLNDEMANFCHLIFRFEEPDAGKRMFDYNTFSASVSWCVAIPRHELPLRYVHGLHERTHAFVLFQWSSSSLVTVVSFSSLLVVSLEKQMSIDVDQKNIFFGVVRAIYSTTRIKKRKHCYDLCWFYRFARRTKDSQCSDVSAGDSKSRHCESRRNVDRIQVDQWCWRDRVRTHYARVQPHRIDRKKSGRQASTTRGRSDTWYERVSSSVERSSERKGNLSRYSNRPPISSRRRDHFWTTLRISNDSVHHWPAWPEHRCHSMISDDVDNKRDWRRWLTEELEWRRRPKQQ